MEYSFKLLLENRSISILAYNLETVLAEKLETILSRSTTTTRMRDYYDVYILTTLREQDINIDVFKEAFKNTAQKRGNYNHLLKSGYENLREIEQSIVLNDLWIRYQEKNRYAIDLTWSLALASVKELNFRAFGRDMNE